MAKIGQGPWGPREWGPSEGCVDAAGWQRWGWGWSRRNRQSPSDPRGLAQTPLLGSPLSSAWISLSARSPPKLQKPVGGPGGSQEVGGAGGGKAKSGVQEAEAHGRLFWGGFSRKKPASTCSVLLSLCGSRPALVRGGQSTWTDPPGAVPG